MRTKEPLTPGGSWLDRHPVLSISFAAVLIYIGLRIYSELHDGSALLASADPQQRLAIYGQIANSAVAILGIVSRFSPSSWHCQTGRSSRTFKQVKPGHGFGRC
jgi:predicted tellurium resistance membrane protein TerC